MPKVTAVLSKESGKTVLPSGTLFKHKDKEEYFMLCYDDEVVPHSSIVGTLFI